MSQITDNYAIGYSEAILKVFSNRRAATHAGHLVPYLKPNMKLLDCGCGPGSITIDFAKILSQGTVTGIDIAEFQIDMASQLAQQHHIDNCSFSIASIDSLPFPDHSFDVVHANAVLCQIKNPLDALAEMKRVVKPGGIISLREPDFQTYIFYPDNPTILRAMELATKGLCEIGGDFYIGRKLKKMCIDSHFKKIIASSSCDSYDTGGLMTAEMACLATANDWIHAPWGKYIAKKQWASQEEIREFQQAFLTLSKDPAAFVSLSWFEVLAFSHGG